MAAAAAVVAGLVFHAGGLMAYPDGVAGRAMSGCSNCHVQDPDVTVELHGPAALTPGTQGSFQLIVNVPDGPPAGGGFDAVFVDAQGAPAGRVVVTDPVNTRGVAGSIAEITHSHSTAPPDWSFDWEAPGEPGASYELRAAGVAVPSPGTELWNFAAPALQIIVPCPDETHRACAVGGCQGTQTCPAGGVFGSCAVTPVAEVCDGSDNDCDGTVDDACRGLTCSGAPGALATEGLSLPKKAARGLRVRASLAAPGLDPASQPLTLQLETAGGKLVQVPDVVLVAKRKAFVYKQAAGTGPGGIRKGSRLKLSPADGGFQLTARLRGVDLGAGLDASAVTLWVRLGTSCFAREFQCRPTKRALRCAA